MTLDEVMALSNEELQIKAAELRGFANLYKEDIWSNHPHVIPPEKDILCGTLEGERAAVPDYLNDIAAAWGLVETMDLGSFKIRKGEVYGVLEDKWSIEFRVWTDRDKGHWYCNGLQDASLARGITRAFVWAMTQGEA